MKIIIDELNDDGLFPVTIEDNGTSEEHNLLPYEAVITLVNFTRKEVGGLMEQGVSVEKQDE